MKHRKFFILKKGSGGSNPALSRAIYFGVDGLGEEVMQSGIENEEIEDQIMSP